MDAFLDMRRDVMRYESDLTGQLAVNEGVRAELERREEFQRSLLNAAQVAILAMDGQGAGSCSTPSPKNCSAGMRTTCSDACRVMARRRSPTTRRCSSAGEKSNASSPRSGASAGTKVPADWRAMYPLAELDRPPHEAVLVHRDGRHVPVVLALAAFQDEAGHPGGLIAVATDLTERKRLEEALRDSEARAQEANLAKSAFLAAMSHEIRTPMIGVTGMVEILAHTPLDADQRRALNVIQSSADSLLQIIGDILDFSKIEAGRLELSPVARRPARAWCA